MLRIAALTDAQLNGNSRNAPVGAIKSSISLSGLLSVSLCNAGEIAVKQSAAVSEGQSQGRVSVIERSRDKGNDTFTTYLEAQRTNYLISFHGISYEHLLIESPKAQKPT